MTHGPWITHQHMAWMAGILGHLLLASVLFARKRFVAFPVFTLFVLFNIMRSLAIALVLHHLTTQRYEIASRVLDSADLLLQFAVVAELGRIALRRVPLARRITLAALLLGTGSLAVLRLTPVSRYHGRAVTLLVHFFLAILMLEWAAGLALLLRQLRLRWRSHVAAITWGFGVYAAVLLAAGGYFSAGREMRDYILFANLRLGLYLLVVVWWAVSLWLPEPGVARSESA